MLTLSPIKTRELENEVWILDLDGLSERRKIGINVSVIIVSDRERPSHSFTDNNYVQNILRIQNDFC